MDEKSESLTMTSSVTRKELLFGLATLTLTLCFFTPLKIYFSNTEEFFTTGRSFAVLSLLLGAGLFVVLSLLFVFQPGSCRRFVLTLAAFFTTALWVQGNLFVWNYGVLDGSALEWHFLHWRGLVDLGLWPGLCLVFLWLGLKKKQRFITLLAVLLFLQGATTLLDCNAYRNELPLQEGEVQEKAIHMNSQFAFSSTRTVIMIVLDAYQSDVFNQYLEENPDYANALPGFIYYPDALTEAFFTEFSIPTLLTGKPLYRQFFPTLASYQEHLNRELMTGSIPALMKEEGYHVGIYTTYAHRYYPPAVYGEIADNYSDTEAMAPHSAGEMRQLVIAATFRLAPHSLKKWIHDRWMLEPSLEQDRQQFHYNLQKDMRIATDQPCFKYYHLQGIHPPQVIDGKAQKKLERGPTMEIAQEINSALALFMKKLQDLKIYDSADIFILGDHGLFWDSPQIEFGRYDQEGIAREPVLDIFVKKPRALPLLLYKQAGAQDAFHEDLRPVSLLDLMPTLAERCLWDKHEDWTGISLLEEHKDTSRSRRFFSSDYAKRTSAPLYEFIIEGFSWHSASWCYTGNVWQNGKTKRIPLDNYRPGTELSFGHQGSALQYLDTHWLTGDGFHMPSLSGARISLPLDQSSSNLMLSLELAPAENHQADKQTLSVLFNDVSAAELEVTEKNNFILPLPRLDHWNKALAPPKRSLSPSSPWRALPPPLSERRAEIRLLPSREGMKVYSLKLDLKEE